MASVITNKTDGTNSQSSENETAGNKNPAGSNPTGSNPTGSNPTGSNPTGSNSAGSNSAGKQIAQLKSATTSTAEQQLGDQANDMGNLSDQAAKSLVHLFKLLADETRLRILYLLLETKELNVRSLCELLNQSQPAVSHHLALLRVAGLIECRREGKHNFYRLLPEKFQEWTGLIFAAAPGNDSQLQIGDWVLQVASSATS